MRVLELGAGTAAKTGIFLAGDTAPRLPEQGNLFSGRCLGGCARRGKRPTSVSCGRTVQTATHLKTLRNSATKAGALQGTTLAMYIGSEHQQLGLRKLAPLCNLGQASGPGDAAAVGHGYGEGQEAALKPPDGWGKASPRRSI